MNKEIVFPRATLLVLVPQTLDSPNRTLLIHSLGEPARGPPQAAGGEQFMTNKDTLGTHTVLEISHGDDLGEQDQFTFERDVIPPY